MELKLIDKDGVQLYDDCIIYGHLENDAEMHYFRLGKSPNDGSNEMIASTYGYVHNVTQDLLTHFELIGLALDNLHLLKCD